MGRWISDRGSSSRTNCSARPMPPSVAPVAIRCGPSMPLSWTDNAHGWTISPCSWPSRRLTTARPGPTGRRGRARGGGGARERAAEELADAMEQQRFRQFLFFRQWERLRRRAAKLGIRILGDVPIFVAHDSADVWSRPDRFDLDSTGRPRAVAGVPPDYFTETGQLWGNPLYLWERHAGEGYAWWIQRLSQTLKLVDAIRLDH